MSTPFCRERRPRPTRARFSLRWSPIRRAWIVWEATSTLPPTRAARVGGSVEVASQTIHARRIGDHRKLNLALVGRGRRSRQNGVDIAVLLDVYGVRAGGDR